MAKPNIIRYWSYVSQYTYQDGHVDYTLKMTDLVGIDYFVSGTAPNGSDMASIAQACAATQTAQLIQSECDETTNLWTWLQASDSLVFPTDADLDYADRIDVANSLRPMYQVALGLQLVNYACAMKQLSDDDLKATFGLTDITELKQRLTRQNAIRTQLANETGE